MKNIVAFVKIYLQLKLNDLNSQRHNMRKTTYKESGYKYTNSRNSTKTPKKSVNIRVDAELLEELKQVAKDNSITEISLWEFGMRKAIKYNRLGA